MALIFSILFSQFAGICVLYVLDIKFENITKFCLQLIGMSLVRNLLPFAIANRFISEIFLPEKNRLIKFREYFVSCKHFLWTHKIFVYFSSDLNGICNHKQHSYSVFLP